MFWSFVRKHFKTIINGGGNIRDDIEFIEDKSVSCSESEMTETSSICHEKQSCSLVLKTNQQRPMKSSLADQRYTLDCQSCLLVEMGEKANYLPNMPCGDCGRIQRSPYTNLNIDREVSKSKTKAAKTNTVNFPSSAVSAKSQKCEDKNPVPQSRKFYTKDVVNQPKLEPGTNKRYTLDCHSCLLVEMGEKANYMGLPCDSCGRLSRSPYGYF